MVVHLVGQALLLPLFEEGGDSPHAVGVPWGYLTPTDPCFIPEVSQTYRGVGQAGRGLDVMWRR